MSLTSQPSMTLARQLARARLSTRPLRRLPSLSQRKFHSSPASPSLSSSPQDDAGPNPSAYSSVNPEEISHFDALASEWWDAHGSSRILHLMNPLRHDFIRACRASQPDSDGEPAPASLRYLDVGCGGGIFAESAARLSTTASLTGLDASPEVLSVARAHARRDPALASKLRYVNSPIEALLPPGGGPVAEADQHDVVSVFEVVEHVTAPAEFLACCMAFVRPGGWLIGSTIARTWTSWFTTNFMAEDVLRLVPRGTHDWNKYVNEHEMREFFRHKAGWGIPRTMGVVYVPGVGWKEVAGSEKIGNYFFGIRRDVS